MKAEARQVHICRRGGSIETRKNVAQFFRVLADHAAREMARHLAKEEGIFAGTSSALNVVAALQLAQELGRGSTVATVAVDSGFKYLAGDLYQT